MRKFFIYVCIILLIFATNTFSQPIQSSKIFANPQYFNVKISPQGTYASAVYRDEKHHNLTLIDINSNSIEVEVSIGLDSRLLSYHWLNEKQVYLLAKYNNTTAIMIGTIKGKEVDIKLPEFV